MGRDTEGLEKGGVSIGPCPDNRWADAGRQRHTRVIRTQDHVVGEGVREGGIGNGWEGEERGYWKSSPETKYRL